LAQKAPGCGQKTYYSKKEHEIRRMLMKKFLGYAAAFVFIMHLFIIADDVQTVIEDPNEANKPGEILKLVFDISRYM
jgi:hypothetical protein